MENQEQTEKKVEVLITAAEAIKLDMEPGDYLAIVIKSDEVDQDLINTMKQNLAYAFPDNRVLIFGLGSQDKIDFAVIKKTALEENKQNNSCNTGNFCADCNCGKKEQYEHQK